jgi:NADH:ubiquinone oxidoreductase subunit 5 (subunit L)/multisubunit Na+/H+ antiporter MnhA subunit
VASSASAARPGGFDPAGTLGWSVPLILLAPLFGFVIVLTGVRGRRAASNVTVLTALVMLGATLLVGWARFHQGAPYRIAFQWINVPVSFTGDQRFQGFGVDLAIRIDRYALAGLAAGLVVFLATLIWHRVAGAREPGQVRYHVSVLLLMLSAAGVLVSTDLAELFAFWAVSGFASYLLLGQRWGLESSARGSQVALALPFLGDMSLLSAVGLLYSRFASLDLDRLPPMLHSTPGVGLKSLTVAALLLLGAIFVRACLWPFTAWLTASADAPPAVLALVSAVWPILAGSLLLRALPFVGAAGPQAPRAAGYAFAVAAVAGPLLGLVGTELRRSLLLASSGAVALALLTVLYPASAAAGLTGLLAVALGRAGALLSGSVAAGAMRTVDLRQMGGAGRIMRGTAAALICSVAAFSLGPVAAAAWRPRSLAWIALGAGLFLVALAGFRVALAVATGPLRRRRAFEPGRVREGPISLAVAALLLGVLGLAAAGLAFFTGWLAYLGARPQDVPSVGTYVLWLAVVLVGVAVAAVAFGLRKDSSLALAGLLGARLGTAWTTGEAIAARFLARPGLAIVNGVEGVGLPAVEGGAGRAAASAGRLAGRPLPWIAVAMVAAVGLALIVGLVATGGHL